MRSTYQFVNHFPNLEYNAALIEAVEQGHRRLNEELVQRREEWLRRCHEALVQEPDDRGHRRIYLPPSQALCYLVPAPYYPSLYAYYTPDTEATWGGSYSRTKPFDKNDDRKEVFSEGL